MSRDLSAPLADQYSTIVGHLPPGTLPADPSECDVGVEPRGEGGALVVHHGGKLYTLGDDDHAIVGDEHDGWVYVEVWRAGEMVVGPIRQRPTHPEWS